MNKLKDQFKNRREFGNFEANLQFLQKTKTLKKGSKILEIGCGKGKLLAYLNDQGFDVVGTEINIDRIREINRINRNITVHLVNDDLLPFQEEKFDLVFSLDVFEHIPASDKHLKEVHRVLKHDGYYLLSTPNKWTNTIFETIRWKSLTRWKHDHCSLHSYGELKKRFIKNGYKIEFFDIPIINEFFSNKVRTYLGSPGVLALKLLNPDRWPRNLKTNFFIKAQKITIEVI